jgi:hypothetical protein
VTPEQEEQVRRALAAVADHDRDPRVPTEVAARLDDVLAELTEPRRVAATEPDPAVAARHDQLAARRRRGQRRHRLLVAAAVAVIALAGGAVVVRGIEGGASSDGSSSSAGGAAEDRAGGGSSGHGSGAGAEPRLRTATLAQDVRRVVAGPAAASSRRRLAQQAPAGGGGQGTDGPGCRLPSTAPGGLATPVRLDGRRAVLLVSPPRAGRRTARVLSCTGGAVLATTTVRDR